MKFHVISLGDHLVDPFTKRYNETQAERFTGIVKQGVLADQLGFSGFWIGEHHANDYIVSNPQMILSTIAGLTKRIRLGSAISLLPNTDPVRLAEDFATLDLLSNGRAEIGFGGGITPHVFRLFGQDPAQADEISAENLDLILRLWNEESVTWNGRFRPSLENMRLEPRTYSNKALPIVRAAGRSEGPVRQAAAAGHKLSLLTVATGYKGARSLADLYRSLWREAGHAPEKASVTASAFIYARSDGKAARDYWSNYILNYKTLGQSVREKQGWSQSLVAIMDDLGDKAREKASESWMAGDPSEIIERLHQAYEDIGGFDELSILFDVGGIRTEEALQSMRIFMDDIAPKLRFPARAKELA